MPDKGDAASGLGAGQKGKTKKGAIVIVATNNNNKDYEIRVEVEPDFNEEETTIELIFTLAVRHKTEKIKRTTLDSEVIQNALQAGEDIVAAAVINQFGWFESNFPILADKVGAVSRSRTLPPGTPSMGPKTL